MLRRGMLRAWMPPGQTPAGLGKTRISPTLWVSPTLRPMRCAPMPAWMGLLHASIPTEMATVRAPACMGPDCDDTDEAVFPGQPELCDGVDNDCNMATADGNADPMLLMGCDSTDDADLCTDDEPSCEAGEIVCSNRGAPRLEICDQMDNDCNPDTADGADIATVGNPCESSDDADFCEDDAIACVDGVQARTEFAACHPLGAEG